MLHRHTGHGEAVARITWCIGERGLGVLTGEVGVGKTVAVRAGFQGPQACLSVVLLRADARSLDSRSAAVRPPRLAA